MESILNWEEIVNELKTNDPPAYQILNRIYNYYSDKGIMIIPNTFKDKALAYMGDKSLPPEEALKRIENQQILKFSNKWTGEGAVFNSLRAQRPGMSTLKDSRVLENLIEDSKKNCDFCNPEKYTPEDLFGRIKGEHCITVANLAKYDAWSSLLVFDKHNPLDFSQEEINDYFNTAYTWFNQVNEYDKNYKYPFMVWNCLYKAGASQIHGHAQILMTKEFPYAKIENLYSTIEKYKKYEGKDYFSDLYTLYQSLGLGFSHGKTKVIISLTPLKEKEILIISPESPDKSIEVRETVYKILRCYIDYLGVENFNLAVFNPGITINNLPYLIKIVDRGPLSSKTTDMGGMELYGSSVASYDPYKIMNSLRKCWDLI